MKETHTQPNIPVIFEDEHLLVIEKPVNVLSRARSYRRSRRTLAVSRLPEPLTEQPIYWTCSPVGPSGGWTYDTG
ncbi:MAG: hypothetical protein U5J63_04940 [Fodinibius sp.]|nr:hypothetical protein [Fodinibius sp.]